MKTDSQGNKGSGIVEKSIAVLFFIVTIIIMLFIANMTNENLEKNIKLTLENNTKKLLRYYSKEDKSVDTKTSVKEVISPNKTLSENEKSKSHLEEARLQVTTKNIKESIPIKHKVDVLKTSAINKGEKKVITKGKDGLKEVNKELTYKGETLEDTEVIESKILEKPVNEVILEGVESDIPVFMVPSKGRYSSFYGERWNKQHKGVDIAASIGTPIRASEGGEVIFSGEKGTYGNCVIIKHKNGYETLYAHISKLIAKKGDKVDKGQIIAEVGNTGRSTGPHLHFEVKIKGKHVDPMNYLKDKK